MNNNIEDQLQASEGKYYWLCKASRDAIMTLEPPTWKFTAGNPAALEMFRVKSEAEFLSYEPWELSPELQPDGQASRQKADDMIEKALREGSNLFEWLHKRISGEEFFAEVLLSKVVYGGKEFLLAVVRDITERKKAQEALSLQGEIMKNLSEGVYLIRLVDGVIVYANPKFENMFGYAPGELIGNDVSIVNAPGEKTPEETKKEIIDILKMTGEWHGEVKNIKKDGTYFYCNANVSIFDHPEYGKVLVSVHTDITERKKVEEEKNKNLRELEVFYKASVGREERILELKKKIEELTKELEELKKTNK